MLYLSCCPKAVELKKQFYIIDKEKQPLPRLPGLYPHSLPWLLSLGSLSSLLGVYRTKQVTPGTHSPKNQAWSSRAPTENQEKGALAEIALHKEEHDKWLPPSVWSNRYAVPSHWDLGVLSFFPPFPFCLFFFSKYL